MPTTQHGPLGGRPTHPPSCQRRAVVVLRFVFPQHVMALELVLGLMGVFAFSRPGGPTARAGYRRHSLRSRCSTSRQGSTVPAGGF